jgi:hypothetical protein
MMRILDWAFLLTMTGLLVGLLWQRTRMHGPTWVASVTWSASAVVQSLASLVGENPFGWMLFGAALVGLVGSAVLTIRAARAFWRGEMERFQRS